jgi:hypothetical protein
MSQRYGWQDFPTSLIFSGGRFASSRRYWLIYTPRLIGTYDQKGVNFFRFSNRKTAPTGIPLVPQLHQAGLAKPVHHQLEILGVLVG